MRATEPKPVGYGTEEARSTRTSHLFFDSTASQL